MPRKVKKDALSTHVEPYVFSSDEETPAAKARPLKAVARLSGFGPDDARRQYDDYHSRSNHGSIHTDGVSMYTDRTYTPRPPKKLRDLPWHSAYLLEKSPADPTKHITFVAEPVDPEHHREHAGDFLRRLSDTKRELVRLIHNHWVFRASYYILAQQELEHIHAGKDLSSLKHGLHQLQADIEDERAYQMGFAKEEHDEEVAQAPRMSSKDLKKFRKNRPPKINKISFKATHAAVAILLEQYAASASDLAEWNSAYTYFDVTEQAAKELQATKFPPTSGVVMRRLFFAKRLLMRAVEHHLKTTPLTVDTEHVHALQQYSKHGDEVGAEMVRLREELHDLFPKRTRDGAQTPAPGQKKKGRKAKKTTRKARARRTGPGTP